MTSTAIPFPITIVSSDTTALREISWTLSSFGYQVVASSDWSEHAAWRQMVIPSLLLLDARDEEEIKEVLSSPRTTPFVYRIAFYETIPNPDRLLDLGADDFIRYPVNIGELLSRLKNGGRRLEFERRFKMTESFDQQPGIISKRRFIQKLERQLHNNRDAHDGALVVMGIDSLERLQAQYGFSAVEDATTRLAQCLNAELSSEDFCGIVQEGIFVVLLQECTVSEGVQFGEDISKQFNEQSTAADGKRARQSVSGIVLNWPTGETANDAVHRGVTALGYVRCSGGSLVLDVNEIEEEFSTWKRQFPSYHEVNARHMMEALPLVLSIDDPTLIDRQGLGVYAFASGQSLPPCVPVVDEMGHLLGVVDTVALREYGSDIFGSLDEHLVPVSDTVSGSAPLDEIVNTLAISPKDYLVVVENKKPIGYISYENLAAITVDPMDRQDDSFKELADTGLNSLVVPLGQLI